MGQDDGWPAALTDSVNVRRRRWDVEWPRWVCVGPSAVLCKQAQLTFFKALNEVAHEPTTDADPARFLDVPSPPSDVHAAARSPVAPTYVHAYLISSESYDCN